MAAICRACGKSKDISLPPTRTRKSPCEFCGGFDALINQRTGAVVKKLDNYDYPDNLMPGNPNEPNERAEREENSK